MKKNSPGRFNRNLWLLMLAMMAVLAAKAAVRREAAIGVPVAKTRFGEVKLRTGVRLRYAERGAPAGKPVILLHGYTDSWFSFSLVLPHLEASWRVFVLDQRGHGDSERPVDGYAIPDFAADVVAFMDAKGLKRATVAGHSMGSFVAQQVALTAPERVDRLILIGSATTARNEGTLELQRAVDKLVSPAPEAFAREFQVSTIHHPVPEEFLNRAIAESRKLPAHVWRAALAGLLASDNRPRLGDIRLPTLLLWGDRDSIFPRSEQEALAAQIPNAVLKIYAETGHALHWERPEQFVRDLKDFMK